MAMCRHYIMIFLRLSAFFYEANHVSQKAIYGQAYNHRFVLATTGLRRKFGTEGDVATPFMRLTMASSYSDICAKLPNIPRFKISYFDFNHHISSLFYVPPLWHLFQTAGKGYPNYPLFLDLQIISIHFSFFTNSFLACMHLPDICFSSSSQDFRTHILKPCLYPRS